MQRLTMRPLAAAAAAATAASPPPAAAAAAARARVAAGSGAVWPKPRPLLLFSYYAASPTPAAATTASASAAAAAASASAAATVGGRCGFASESEGRGDRIPSEETPNPNALKFRPLVPRPLVNAKGKVSARNFTKNSPKLADSPMASAILQVEGVESVLIGAGFVSVVKSEKTDWNQIKPLVEHAIRSSTSAQLACAAEAAAAEREESAAAAAAAAAAKVEEKASPAAPLAEEDQELFESIKDTLNHRVRPMLQGDGGDLEVLSFDRERGELYVHLLGSCRGCPSSTVTVKRGMEQMLRYYYPEVEAVIECDENGEPLEQEEDTDEP